MLEALIRTVLSCNTSNRNSTAAHKSLVARFGKCNWQAILDAPHQDLVDAIACGGLANNKGKTIRGILEQTKERHGVLSLDHLHDPSVTDDQIMHELLSFGGVGPKVATCVSMFCIGRETFAVDTHVFRLSKMLGWVPDKTANRDTTCYHLEEKLPAELKYPLHVLLIKHGKRCKWCSARGFATVKDEGPSGSESEAEEEEEEEGEEDLKEDEAGAEADAKAKSAGKTERQCPLRAHNLVHRRTWSKKTGSATKGSAKKKVEEQDDEAEAQASPSKGRKPPAKRVKKEDQEETNGVKKEDEDADVSGASRRSTRKRAKRE